MTRVERRGSRPRIEVELNRQLRMIKQILSDRKVGTNADFDRAKLVCRSDTRSHQNGRRMNCARTENDFVSLDTPPFTAYLYQHCRRTRSVKLNTINHRLADDRKIIAIARGFQISVVARHANMIAAIDRVWRHAGSNRRVVIVAPAVTRRYRGFSDSTIDRAPFFAWRTIYRNRSAAAMIGTVAKRVVVLKLDEGRKNFCR